MLVARGLGHGSLCKFFTHGFFLVGAALAIDFRLPPENPMALA
jgi:hypothetical protein